MHRSSAGYLPSSTQISRMTRAPTRENETETEVEKYQRGLRRDIYTCKNTESGCSIPSCWVSSRLRPPGPVSFSKTPTQKQQRKRLGDHCACGHTPSWTRRLVYL